MELTNLHLKDDIINNWLVELGYNFLYYLLGMYKAVESILNFHKTMHGEACQSF